MDVWGAIALISLLAASVAASTTPWRPGMRPLAVVAAAAGWAAIARLALAFWAEAWHFDLVAGHTRPGLAWPLRVSSLWAGPEGSLLLWTSLLATLGAFLAVRRSRASPLVSGLTAAYSLVLLAAANPFLIRADAPHRGIGLQPVLEHPALIWHPPILYGGMLTALVAGCTALFRGHAAEGDSSGATPTTRLAGIGLGLLTAGLAAGARWAHVEMGWGGYWAWDPVENAGLVVWIACAALVHTGNDDRRRIIAGAATALASVWGTTMTRSGAVVSVHAFADRAPLRSGLLVASGAFTIAVLVMAVRSWPGARTDPPLSRSVAAGLMSVSAAALVVALGTYEPAIEAVFGGDTAMISGRYYTSLLWPIVIAGALACCAVDRAPLAAGIGAVLGILTAGAAVGFYGLAVAAAGGGVAGSALRSRRRSGTVAHFGMGVLLIGVAGTFAATRSTVHLNLDQTVVVDGHELTHRSIELSDDGVLSRAQASVEVDGEVLHPELVVHQLRATTAAEMAERHRVGSTTQIVLVDGDADGARYRLYHQPRIGLVWAGSLLSAVGALGAAFSARGAQDFSRRLRASR